MNLMPSKLEKVEEQEFEEVEVFDKKSLYLKVIFPIFLIFVGVFLVIVSLVTDKGPMTVYIGIGVTVFAVLWDILSVASRNKKRRKKLLKNQ